MCIILLIDILYLRNLFILRVNWEQSLVIQNKHHSSDINAASSTASNLTSVIFNDEDTTEADQRNNYIIFYSVLMAVATYIFVHRTFAFYALCLRATTNLHDQVFRGISRATMFFYNTNPTGRILNRFAKDIGNIDVLLPPALMDALSVSGKSLSLVQKNLFLILRYCLNRPCLNVWLLCLSWSP